MTRILAALIVGVMVGAAVAAVRADEPPRRAAPRPIAAATTDFKVRVFSERIVLRVADPAGGPEWAVKLIQSQRTRNGRNVAKPQTCVRLGRIEGGRFGWIHGDGLFRPGETIEHLEQCMPRAWRKPTAHFVSTLAVADPAAPRITAGVVWGRVPGASQVTVRGSDGADGTIAATDGVFLRVLGPGARPRPGATVRGGGREAPLAIGPVADRVRKSYPRVIPGTERIGARAPDPGGGPSYGVIVADTREGVPCVAGATRIVDGRYGGVHLGYGLFWETVAYDSLCRPLSERLTRKLPCTWSSGYGGGASLGEDEFMRRARVERRVQPGRTVFTAICLPEVERVMLQSPRDTRTLVPSATGHVVLAVYDGVFYDGPPKLTAVLRGGAERSLGGP